MYALICLATSYAPGHNFWSGSPFDWWFRGTVAFFLMIGPVLAAGILLVLFVARRIRSVLWLIPIMVMGIAAVMANSLYLRDGDKPWFIGGVWGQRIAPWLALVMIALAAVAHWRSRILRSDRGFEVIT